MHVTVHVRVHRCTVLCTVSCTVPPTDGPDECIAVPTGPNRFGGIRDVTDAAHTCTEAGTDDVTVPLCMCT